MKGKKHINVDGTDYDLLLVGRESVDNKGYLDLILIDENKENCESFRLFAYDVLTELFMGKPSIVTVFYDEKTVMKKTGLFKKEQETSYINDGFTWKLVRYINSNGIDCKYDSYIIYEGTEKNKRQRKVLRIFREHTDKDYIMSVFCANDSLNETPHLCFSIECNIPDATDEDMKVFDNKMRANTAIVATNDEWDERMLFLVKFDAYPKNKFLNCIRNTAKKHNKKICIRIADDIVHS